MKRSTAAEPMLPLDFRQPRRGVFVTAGVYAAVLALRRAGHAVYSVAEFEHKVDGRIVSTAQLKALAAGVGDRGTAS